MSSTLTKELNGKTKPKVLVTGADGFIGSHLTEELCRRGYQVRALTYYNSFGFWGWLEGSPALGKENLEVFAGDIRDPANMQKAVEGCEAVLHLAALIAIPYSYVAPASYVDTNVMGTLNLLQAALDQKVKKFIHTSTSEVYGTAQFVPITEDHPLVGQSPYSASKIGADQLAVSYHRSFELPVSVIRPFNTYGPRQSARAVIPTIISQIASGKTKLSLGSAHPTRDFNFVDDTVNGFIAALEAPEAIGQVINLASNFEISVGDTATLIAELMGAKIDIQVAADRLRPQASEVERLFGDNQKAKKLIGWAPKHGGREGFALGLRKTIEWFSVKENLACYKPDQYSR